MARLSASLDDIISNHSRPRSRTRLRSDDLAQPQGGKEYHDEAGDRQQVRNLREERKAEERKAEKARKIERDKELRRKRAEIAEKGDK